MITSFLQMYILLTYFYLKFFNSVILILEITKQYTIVYIGKYYP